MAFAAVMTNAPHSSRRVVVTGLGVIAPNGCTVDEFWTSIRDGRSSAGPLTRFPVGNSPVKIACELRDWDPHLYMEAKTARRLDRSLQYGVAAARQAVEDARLDIPAMDADRIGVVEGTSVSNNQTAARAEEAYAASGYRGVSLFAM